MKNLNPLEKDIERAVCDYAKSLKMLCYKFTSPSRRSVPDRMFITAAGVVFFIEFKRKGEKPTAGQEVEIEKIFRTGTYVAVVDDVTQGKSIIEKMQKALRAQHDPSDPHFYDNLILENHKLRFSAVDPLRDY